ncbi:MAG: undecaprenyl/decaprenyl-phosphate alpha-N-acetylglucosaminyl 1-phosphate transferase [Proteobacteria bacterium]|nr:undecaprenyl/decaprenyl-phosphate alpha-N-acetylglucosaminyl 1-phosphate transferase [Pseudomonadota bacterium]
MLSFFALIVAMFITMMLIPPLMKSAERFSFVDMPDARKVHTAPVPRIGGVAMVAGAVTPILLWMHPEQDVRGLLYGICLILFFGVWDDRAALDYRVKFVGQLLAICVVVFYGGVVIRFIPFHSFEPIPDYVAYPLTVFALLGVTNAINLSDGLDGLAAGTTFLSVGMISLMAYMVHDYDMFMLAMALLGCIIGFLRFNTHPAQIFMGDGGSQFLGFAAGVLVIQLTQKSGTILSPAMPLLLLGLPLIDTFLVMGQRLAEGRSPFRPDKNHLHHKLMALGFDHYEAVVVIYSLQTTLVTLAYLLRYRSDLASVATFLAVLVTIGGFFPLAQRLGWRVHRERTATAPSAITRFAGRLKSSGLLGTVPVLMAAMSIPVYACVAIMLTGEFPNDAMLTAYVLAGTGVAMLLLRRNHASYALLERLLLYVAVTTVVFYWGRVQTESVWLHRAENVYFGALGLALMTAYRFTRNRNFSVTPTDFLIIFIALVVPTVSSSLFPQNNVTEVAIKVLILFYAVELIVAQAAGRLWLLRVTVAATMSLLALRVGMVA